MKVTVHNMSNRKSESFEFKFGGISIKIGDESFRLILDDKDGVSLLKDDGSIVKLDNDITDTRSKKFTDKLKDIFKGGKL